MDAVCPAVLADQLELDLVQARGPGVLQARGHPSGMVRAGAHLGPMVPGASSQVHRGRVAGPGAGVSRGRREGGGLRHSYTVCALAALAVLARWLEVEQVLAGVLCTGAAQVELELEQMQSGRAALAGQMELVWGSGLCSHLWLRGATVNSGYHQHPQLHSEFQQFPHCLADILGLINDFLHS